MLDIIQTKDLCFSYNEKPVLKNINVAFKGGELTSIIGPNGAGKSTLLSLLQFLLIPDAGTIYLNDKSFKEYSRSELSCKIAGVSQFSNLIFPFSVLEVVLMGRYPYKGALAFESKEDVSIAVEVLRLTNALLFKDRFFNELSGGEKQRILIARALAQTTPIILFDEPTSSLDLKHQKFIFELLLNLAKKEKKNIIVISHDINLASLYSDRLILLKDGVIVKDGAPGEILDEKLLSDVYETEVSIEISRRGPPFVRILPNSQ